MVDPDGQLLVKGDNIFMGYLAVRGEKTGFKRPAVFHLLVPTGEQEARIRITGWVVGDR